MFSKVWQIIIEHYTVQQRIEIVRCDHQNSLSVRAAFGTLCEIYGQHHRLIEDTIRRIVEKFETTGLVVDQPTPVSRRNAHSDENIVTVQKSVSEDPNLSIPHRGQELGLPQISTWRNLLKDLGFFLTRFN